MAPLDILRGFDTLGRRTINDPQNAPALFSLGYDYLHRVRGGAEDLDNLRDLPDSIQDIDGIAVAHDNDKTVPGTHGKSVPDGAIDEVRLVSVAPDQARSGGFAEGHAKFHAGYCTYYGFIDIFHRLDEMTLPQNDVDVFRNLEANGQ